MVKTSQLTELAMQMAAFCVQLDPLVASSSFQVCGSARNLLNFTFICIIVGVFLNVAHVCARACVYT